MKRIIRLRKKKKGGGKREFRPFSLLALIAPGLVKKNHVKEKRNRRRVQKGGESDIVETPPLLKGFLPRERSPIPTGPAKNKADPLAGPLTYGKGDGRKSTEKREKRKTGNRNNRRPPTPSQPPGTDRKKKRFKEEKPRGQMVSRTPAPYKKPRKKKSKGWKQLRLVLLKKEKPQ